MYLGAISGARFRPERKKNILLHSLGFEGRSVFKYLPALVLEEGEEIDEYAETVKKLELRFDIQPSLVVIRHKFFKREQNPGEDVDTFVSALRKLAADCQFQAFSDQLVRDQFIAKCTDKSIQQKLLSLNNPSLDETLRLAKSIETSKLSVKELESRTTENIGMVNSQDGKILKSTKTSSKPCFKQSNICFRCGNMNHIKSGRGCPAKNATGRKCNKVGQFAKVCQSGTMSVGYQQGSGKLPNGSGVAYVTEVDDGDVDRIQEEFRDMVMIVTEDQIVTGDPTRCVDPYVEIGFGDKVIKRLVDSGARITMITQELCKEEAFEWIKSQLVEPKILKPFDPDVQCIITVDASSFGVGDVLTQAKEGNKNVRADFFSRFPLVEDAGVGEDEHDVDNCFIAAVDLEDMCVISECEMSVEDDILMRGERFVRPESRRKRIVAAAHEGHLGRTLTKRRLRETEEDNVVLPRPRDSRLTSRARERELETLGVERTVEGGSCDIAAVYIFNKMILTFSTLVVVFTTEST
ncbi:hypothetical protein NDU88_005639 [Pleurodeles waltl]|uniref:Reverse transcriptase/retrotransposon-derived protein RNase H-like domain-containing protein n=1 Tax=Pleurodeles waltl TaxID=8319 RepID=A0AAV7TD62_PLEWA|nr:hypothetical protein NDU88_005639 [Pleurodeles waltl]